MFLTEISPLAVIFAAALNIALGFVWYAPFVFGRVWLRESGRESSSERNSEGMLPTYIILTIASLVLGYILGVLITRFEALTFGDGAQLGFWLWLGLVAPVKLNDLLFGGRSQKAFLIDAGFYLVALVLMGGVLAIAR